MTCPECRSDIRLRELDLLKPETLEERSRSQNE